MIMVVGVFMIVVMIVSVRMLVRVRRAPGLACGHVGGIALKEQ